MTSQKPYEVVLDIRWSDVDQRGHVNNVNIVALAAEARMRFHFRHLALTVEDTNWLVAHQSVDYHREVRYGPPLRMQVGVVGIGRTSYRLRQRGFQDGSPAFTVEATLVMGGADGTPRPVGPGERELLSRASWPGDGADPEEPNDNGVRRQTAGAVARSDDEEIIRW